MLNWAFLPALTVLAGSVAQEGQQGSLFGFSLCSIADLDRDGVREIAVGDPFAATWSGEVSIYSGRSGRIVRMLTSDGNRVAFGWTIESMTAQAGDVRWAVAAAGMGAGRPYVEVFDGGGLRPVIRLEAAGHEHVFGNRIAFSPKSVASPAFVVLASVRGVRSNDTSEGAWTVSAWSLLDGAELWRLPAGDWIRAESPWIWTGLPLTSKELPSILVAGRLEDESSLALVRLEPRTGERMSESSPTGARKASRSLAFLHVDGDAVPDLLLGYPSEDPSVPGEANLVSGATANLIRGHTGKYPGSGSNVAMLGDLDCDGLDDYAIASFGLIEPGIVSVHSGADGSLLHSWVGDAERIGHQHFGKSMRGVDDLDGDGVNDVVIGSTNPFAPEEGGSVWVYSGRGGTLLWSVER